MASRRSRSEPVTTDLAVTVGSVRLPNPVMTASGTAGHGVELARYVDLGSLGAVVVKSLAAFAWDGNPAPRLAPTAAGMLNAVGLQGPGVAAWLAHDLPALARTGARVVVSIWGRTIEDYEAAARLVAQAPNAVVAVEVNLSCPNLDGGRHLFAHDPVASAAVIAATAACGLPRWAKLSPNTDRLAEVAAAVHAAGAEAVTCVNTVLGLALDPETGHPLLGAGGGGLSGPAIHPIALRCVADLHRAHPQVPIVGVGGITDATGAVAMLSAGASAIQVGTATFADPRAPARVLDGLGRWCDRHSTRPADLVGRALKGTS